MTCNYLAVAFPWIEFAIKDSEYMACQRGDDGSTDDDDDAELGARPATLGIGRCEAIDL